MDYKEVPRSELLKEIQKLKDAKPFDVSYNNITMKAWDKKALKGLNATAQALLNITKVYAGTNVTIHGIHVDNTDIGKTEIS